MGDDGARRGPEAGGRAARRRRSRGSRPRGAQHEGSVQIRQQDRREKGDRDRGRRARKRRRTSSAIWKTAPKKRLPEAKSLPSCDENKWRKNPCLLIREITIAACLTEDNGRAEGVICPAGCSAPATWAAWCSSGCATARAWCSWCSTNPSAPRRSSTWARSLRSEYVVTVLRHRSPMRDEARDQPRSARPARSRCSSQDAVLLNKSETPAHLHRRQDRRERAGAPEVPLSRPAPPVDAEQAAHAQQGRQLHSL